MAGNEHGHTLAAWTGVTICTIGFCIAGFFTVLAQPVGLIGGLVVAAGGGVVGMLLRTAGLGQPKESERGGFIRSDAAEATGSTKAAGSAKATDSAKVAGTAKAAQAQEQTS